MPGAPRTYSDRQREAAIRRINHDGLSAAAVVEEAKAGELDGLEPFAPSTATVERWASEAARYEDPAANLPSRGDVESAALRLWELHLASLAELEALRGKDERTEKEQRALDHGTLAAIKRQRELNHLLIRPAAPEAEQDPRDAPRQATTGEPLLERLARQHAIAGSDSSGQEDEPGQSGEDASPVTSHAPTRRRSGARARQENAAHNDGVAVPA